MLLKRLIVYAALIALLAACSDTAAPEATLAPTALDTRCGDSYKLSNDWHGLDQEDWDYFTHVLKDGNVRGKVWSMDSWITNPIYSLLDANVSLKRLCHIKEIKVYVTKNTGPFSVRLRNLSRESGETNRLDITNIDITGRTGWVTLPVPASLKTFTFQAIQPSSRRTGEIEISEMKIIGTTLQPVASPPQFPGPASPSPSGPF